MILTGWVIGMSLNPIEATALLSKMAHRDETCWAFTHRLIFSGGVQTFTEEYIGVYNPNDDSEAADPIFTPYEAVAVAEKIIRDNMEASLEDDEEEDEDDIRQG